MRIVCPADDYHEISCLIGYFWKSSKIWNCRLLQIIGGALRVSLFVIFFQVTKLSDFFSDDTIFVAYGQERRSNDDFNLNDHGKSK